MRARLQKGTPCVLVDVDGTLNVGDESMVEQARKEALRRAERGRALS